MLEHIRLLIFDLDYLIFDCAMLKVRALRQSLISFAEVIPQDVRLPDAVDAEEGYLLHGFRWTQFLEIGLAEELQSQVQQAYRIHEDRLLEAGVGQVFPGVQELLARCRQSGVHLALGAEASRDYLMSVCDRYTLDKVFQIALCTEEFGVGSADEMLEEIMRYQEVNPSETLVMGTRSTFFKAAHNLNTMSIGCGWGIHQHAGLGDADFQSLTVAKLYSNIQEADNLCARFLS